MHLFELLLGISIFFDFFNSSHKLYLLIYSYFINVNNSKGSYFINISSHIGHQPSFIDVHAEKNVTTSSFQTPESTSNLQILQKFIQCA